MQFDPAIAAREAFQRSKALEELGPDFPFAVEMEEIFSSSAGEEAKKAYFQLLELGKQHWEARAFQEFLIYITWQQVTEETIPQHFQNGLALCNDYLTKFSTSSPNPKQVEQIKELKSSYKHGLGLVDTDPQGFEEDMFKGGD